MFCSSRRLLLGCLEEELRVLELSLDVECLESWLVRVDWLSLGWRTYAVGLTSYSLSVWDLSSCWELEGGRIVAATCTSSRVKVTYAAGEPSWKSDSIFGLLVVLVAGAGELTGGGGVRKKG
jgi:hypothetical protein